MKKIFLSILMALLLMICYGCGVSTPKDKVSEYFNNYTTLSEGVISSMNNSIAKEKLSVENQNVYREVLTKQYQDMKYTIKEEKIDGDKSTVTVRITVYDLHKAENVAMDYLANNYNEFYVNDVLNEEEFNKYRVNNMLNTVDTIDYDVDIYLTKENGTWIVQNPDSTTLEKIHGLYDYDS